MTFQGLDPAAVNHTAEGLARQAAALDKVAHDVDALIRTAMHHWTGPEAQDFHQWWVGQHRPRLVAAAQGVHAAAAGVRRQVGEQLRASGMAGESADHWIDPTDPELSVGGSHTFMQGEHLEYSPAPGSREWTDSGEVEGQASASLGKDGLAAAAGLSATAMATGSRTTVKGPGDTSLQIGTNQRIGAEAGASAHLGRDGASVGAQAMVGVSAGADATLGNDQVRATGRAEVVGGLGAEGHASARLENGKLKLGGKLGVALGIGAKVGGDVEINVAGPLHAADGARKAVTGWFGRLR